MPFDIIPPFQPIRPIIPSEIQMNDVDPPLNSLSLSFEEQLYANYLRDPDSVSPDWRQYFDELSRGDHAGENRDANEPWRGQGVEPAAPIAADGNGHKLQLGPQFRPGSFFARPPQARGNAAARGSAGRRTSNRRHGGSDHAIARCRRRTVAVLPCIVTGADRRFGDAAGSGRSVDPRLSRSRSHGGEPRSARSRRARNCRNSTRAAITSPKPTWIGRSRPTRSKARR